jgi:hypothetical protein
VYFRAALAVDVPYGGSVGVIMILATRSSAACRCFIATCSNHEDKEEMMAKILFE